MWKLDEASTNVNLHYRSLNRIRPRHDDVRSRRFGPFKFSQQSLSSEAAVLKWQHAQHRSSDAIISRRSPFHIPNRPSLYQTITEIDPTSAPAIRQKSFASWRKKHLHVSAHSVALCRHRNESIILDIIFCPRKYSIWRSGKDSFLTIASGDSERHASPQINSAEKVEAFHVPASADKIDTGEGCDALECLARSRLHCSSP